MREIKFRGKRVDNGEWVYGFLCQPYNAGWKTYIAIGSLENNKFQPTLYEVDPKTVSQFTGRLDCKGKEIWEGDILQGLHGKYPVIWNNERAGFETRIEGFAAMRAENWKEREIIGNVHEEE